jgi:hypothetical protein
MKQSIKNRLAIINNYLSIEERYSIEYPGSIDAAYKEFESKLDGFQLQIWNQSSDLEKIELFHYYVEFFKKYDEDKGDALCMRTFLNDEFEYEYKNNIWM